MWLQIVAVAVGGAIGSAGRFLISVAARKCSTLVPPTDVLLGTLAVNLLGSFAIGLIAACMVNQFDDRPILRLFLVSGILGGFTTFSAFSLETLELLHRHRIALAATYAVGSVLLGLALAFLGWRAGSVLFPPPLPR